MCEHKVPIKSTNGKTYYVPCGKCDDCLRHKQNEFTVRAYRAAVYYGSMHLVTLTYEDKYVPVECSVVERSEIDLSSVKCISDAFLLSDTEYFYDGKKRRKYRKDMQIDTNLRDYYFANAPIGFYTDSRGRRHEYYKPLVMNTDDECVDLFIAQTVNKSDVQDTLKKFRIQYERKNGKLPEFKYVIIPEYGGTTGRPHFHMLFFGLSDGIVSSFCRSWKFGFTDCRKVMAVNEDFSDGFQKCAAYVSKYVSKGNYELDFVKKGYVQKPRITCSRFLGLEDEAEIIEMRRFALAYDVFEDKYSINTPFVVIRDSVDEDSGEVTRKKTYIKEKVFPTLEAIARRMYVNIGGFHYPLPKSFKDVFYHVYDPIKKRYKASALSDALAAHVEALALSDAQREFEQLDLDMDSEAAGKAYVEILNRKHLGSGIDSGVAREQLLRAYRKSVLR